VYNQTLATRKRVWDERGEPLSLYDTSNLLVSWKKDKPELANAFSQCLQDSQLRVDLAFKAFFKRVRLSKKPGYPRFKGYDRYDSFTFPQSGFKLIDNKVKLSKVGSVRIKKHRELHGVIKTLTIRRGSTSKWYACFSCEVEPKPLQKTNAVVGIDVGLKSFATFSNGERIDNPRFFKTEEKNLARAQRRLSKAEKGTPIRHKHRKVVAHIHLRIANKRKDFAHKLSYILVKKYHLIAFERLNIKDMRENGFKGIRKSIGDVAWNQFVQFTAYKAEGAGRAVVFVDPRNTSKRCSGCGQIVEKKLSDRIHSCSCGLVLDRDHNASINILALGLQGIGSSKEAVGFS
jgi:putative transposase